MMMLIRTPKGKMYGTIDLRTYMLHIKDGKNMRIIKIPDEGMKLIYTSGSSPPEEIYIPPKPKFFEN